MKWGMACSKIPGFVYLFSVQSTPVEPVLCFISISLPVLSLSPFLALLLPALPLEDSELHVGPYSSFRVPGEGPDPVSTQVSAFTLHL